MTQEAQIEKETAELRMKLKADPMFSIELLGAITKVCRGNGVTLSNDLLGRIVLARHDELTQGLSVPVLPGGTNCQN